MIVTTSLIATKLTHQRRPERAHLLEHVDSSTAPQVSDIYTIRHEPTRPDELAIGIDRRQPAHGRKFHDPCPVRRRERIPQRDKPVGTFRFDGRERRLDIIGAAQLQQLECYAQLLRRDLHILQPLYVRSEACPADDSNPGESRERLLEKSQLFSA